MNVINPKTNIKGAFDDVVDQLSTALNKAGFVICGAVDFQAEHWESLGLHRGKYKVLFVDSPSESSRMLWLQPHEGTILPACLSVIEVHPGEILIVVTNPTEVFASLSNQEQLASQSRYVKDSLKKVVNQLRSDTTSTHDLVTSWD
jgi:uncharacterized protein (DUF302 family)